MTNPVVLSLNTLTGYKVQNAAGEDLGRIDDLVLDQKTGRVQYAVLAFGGIFGMGNRLVAIPWPSLRLRNDNKVFVLNIDKETLQHAPSFDKAHWPDMSLPEWRDKIETYFTYNPAEEPQIAEGSEYIEDGPHAISVEDEREEQGLSRRVEFELEAAEAFEMKAIQITVVDGTVILNGKVGSRAELILADNIARAVRGVQSVKNNLKVSKAA
jgi:sporulation protein YlmC with PRC-barrel domain